MFHMVCSRLCLEYAVCLCDNTLLNVGTCLQGERWREHAVFVEVLKLFKLFTEHVTTNDLLLLTVLCTQTHAHLFSDVYKRQS